MQNFISYGKQSIDESDIKAVVDVLRGDFLTQGPSIEEFEKDFCSYSGAQHCVAVSNGTAALHLACMALGIGKGDAVLVPAITFAASANAVLYCGATPIFIDIDAKTFCIDYEELEEGLELARNLGLIPRAIIPVHYAGLPANLEQIHKIAKTNDLVVIEDGCHAVGAQFKGKADGPWQRLGESKSSFVAWSFHPVKHITTGEGGALTTQSEELASKIRALRSHGITKKSEEFRQKNLAFSMSSLGRDLINPWYHEMQNLGYNYRICDIQAALGKSQLVRATSFVERRREIASAYREQLSGLDFLTQPPSDTATSFHSYHLFPVRINFDELGRSRAEVMQQLKESGVGTQVHYLPVYWHTFYREHHELWASAGCPTAEAFYQQELSIPMYPSMTIEDVSRVVDAIKMALK